MSQGFNLEYRKSKINEALHSTSNLKTFFDYIPVDRLKQAFSKIINDIDDPIPLGGLYYGVRSIDDIFPKDIIQYIISFQGLHLENTKFVNKQWNELSHLNEKMALLKMEQHENQYGLPYDKKYNTTRIISCKRNHLTTSEKDMGFEMGRVLRTLDRFNYYYKYEIDISNAISGDRYFFYPGHYRINNSFTLRKKNLSFIGVASPTDYEIEGLHSSVRIYIHNDNDIDIYGTNHHQFRNNKYSSIYLKASELRILRCKIRSVECGIYVGNNSSLSVIKSQIQAAAYDTAVRIAKGCNKVVIKQSVINNSKHCIQFGSFKHKDWLQGTKLICENNIFLNIFAYAIIIRAGRIGMMNCDDTKSYEMYKKSVSCQIKNNEWNWRYKGSQKPLTQNHNRIYAYREPVYGDHEPY